MRELAIVFEIEICAYGSLGYMMLSRHLLDSKDMKRIRTRSDTCF